jgi:hypothetical protein
MSLVTLCPHCHIQVDVLMIEACKQPVCLKSCEVVELDPSVFAALFPEAVITQQASLAFEKTSRDFLLSQMILTLIFGQRFRGLSVIFKKPSLRGWFLLW